METTLYIRMQLARRPQYRLATELRQQNGSRYFVKRALNQSAQPFLQGLFANYQRMLSAFPHCQILEPRKYNDLVRFNLIEAQTLAHAMADAALTQERETFVGIIRRFRAILDAAQVGDSTSPPNEAFSELLQNSRSPDDDLISIGAIDLCFDNIMDTSGKPTIIDYEWIFPFAVPKAYLAFRAVVGLYGRISNRKPERICPLAEALALAGVSTDNFNRFASYEDAFEELTSGRKSDFSTSFKNLLASDGKRSDPNRTSIVLRLAEMELECERKQAWILKIEKDNQELKSALAEISANSIKS